MPPFASKPRVNAYTYLSFSPYSPTSDCPIRSKDQSTIFQQMDMPFFFFTSTLIQSNKDKGEMYFWIAICTQSHVPLIKFHTLLAARDLANKAGISGPSLPDIWDWPKPSMKTKVIQRPHFCQTIRIWNRSSWFYQVYPQVSKNASSKLVWTQVQTLPRWVFHP